MAHSVFQSKRKLLKNPECKKFVSGQTVYFQDKLLFSEQIFSEPQ